jgi:hypothetical protein
MSDNYERELFLLGISLLAIGVGGGGGGVERGGEGYCLILNIYSSPHTPTVIDQYSSTKRDKSNIFLDHVRSFTTQKHSFAKRIMHTQYVIVGRIRIF